MAGGPAPGLGKGPRPLLVLASRHGKERAMARPFRLGLGLELVVADQIDTDHFGTFTGERPRPADAATTCRLKAEAAMDATGACLGVASEGSFGPHPAIPFLPLAIEWMTFVDRRRDLVISERLEGTPTNFSHSVIAAGADPGSWLERIGFPAHGVIVSPQRSDPHPSDPYPIVRGLHSPEALAKAIRGATAHSADGLALLQSDMRAHCNPTRMASIRRLAFRLVRRIRTACPSCGYRGGDWWTESQACPAAGAACPPPCCAPRFTAAPIAISAPKCLAATVCFGPIPSTAATAILEARRRPVRGGGSKGCDRLRGSPTIGLWFGAAWRASTPWLLHRFLIAMQFDDFRDLAEVEDSMWYFHALNQRMLLPLAQLAKQEVSILDAGCGTGGLIKALQHHDPRWLITAFVYAPLACDFERERTTGPSK